MPEDLKVCTRKKCPRSQTAVYTDGDFCSACGSKLRASKWGNTDKDTPVLIDIQNQRQQAQRNMDDYNRDRHRHHQQAQAGFGFSYGGDRRLPEHYQQPAYGKQAEDEVWHCDPDVEGCPIMKHKPVVKVSNRMYHDWIWLCKVNSTEWIAYLKGEPLSMACPECGKLAPEAEEVKACQHCGGSQLVKDAERAGWLITDMYFPKQYGAGAHVNAEDGEIQPGTVASVHSHVGMAAFFSGEDKLHFNHAVEMVINRKGEMECMVRVKLECGRYSRIKAEVVLVGDERQTELQQELSRQLTDKSNSYARYATSQPSQPSQSQPSQQDSGDHGPNGRAFEESRAWYEQAFYGDGD